VHLDCINPYLEAFEEPVLIVSSGEYVLDANVAMAQRLQIPLESLTGQLLRDLIVEPPAWWVTALQYAATQGVIDTFFRFRCADGSVFRSQARVKRIGALTVADAPLFCLRCVDLAEQTAERYALTDLPGQTAKELERLNWALTACTASISAIMRARNTQDVMNRICDSIAAQDIYCLAWVGLAEDGPGKPLAIRAKAGPATAYLNAISLSWSDDKPEGNGPVGRAVRSGLPYMVGDLLADPTFDPWREHALAHGIRSCVTIPFVSDGRDAGVLAVYAVLPDAFGTRELTFFVQLADQLGFAISLEEDRASLKATSAAWHKAEKTARDEHDFAEALVRSLPGILYVYDSRGRVLRWNENFERLSGYTADEIRVMTPVDFFADGDHAGVAKWIEQVFAQGSSFVEVDLISKSGQGTPCYVTGVSATIDGETCLVGIGIDLTERRRMETALRDTRAEFFRFARVSTLGEMTTTIAHEINQPLAAIVTNSAAAERWLAHDPPALSEVHNALARITRDSNRAHQVIQRTRAFVMKAQPVLALIDLNGCIREVLVATLHEQSKAHITVHRQLAPGLPNVLGDRVQLQQVIVNLVLNAIDAMADVTDRERLLTATTELTKNDEILVTISDTGVGLGTTGSDQLFEQFFTTKPEGTGLGLAISKSIVLAHGGRIMAGGAPDYGAIFRFILPVAAQ
jgi:PAS domain S-box-containing protein